MFENPNEKIKNAAGILFRLALICSAIILIVGFCMLVKASNDSYDIEFLGKCYESDDDLIAAGWMNILYSVLLVPVSYLSSLLIYGFGEIVANNSSDNPNYGEIEDTVPDNNIDKPLSYDDELYELDTLLNYGLITSEEYDEKKKELMDMYNV